MKTIIAGSRTICDPKVLQRALRLCGWTPTIVVCGMAPGADLLGKDWADAHGILVDPYPAEWEVYGRKRAGSIRNMQMAQNAEALLALWDGESPGTRNMIAIAKSLGLRWYVHRV